MEICDKIKCTGCGACAQRCPKKCISMKEDSVEALYPQIDEENCILCGLCQKTCPNNNKFDLFYPQKAYAAWSNEESDRLQEESRRSYRNTV